MRILLAAFAFFVLSLLGLKVWVSGFLEKELDRSLRESCPACQFHWQRFSLLPGVLTIEGVEFSVGKPAITAYEAKLARLEAHFSLFHPTRISSIRLDHPEVIITEGDEKSLPREPKPEKPFSYSVSSVEIHQGTFRYVHLYPRKNAVLRVVEIEGSINAFGSALPIQETRAVATGLLEQSGRFTLEIRTPLYGAGLQAQVDLKLQNLLLAQLNPFFEPSSGVRLEGELLHGHSTVNLVEQKEDAYVSASYKDFNIHFEKTKERSALAAFFGNLFKSLKLDSSSLDRPRSKRQHGVSAVRNSSESLVSFIFRGMKEAALRVVED